MKIIFFHLFTLITVFTYGQNVELIADSLSLDVNNTWIDMEGSRFTELGQNCNFGREITFMIEDNRAIFIQCSKGVWKKFDFEFKVKGSDDEHFIELYNKGTRLEDYEIEAQLISDDGVNFKTELTLYSFKDRRTYTLTSKKI